MKKDKPCKFKNLGAKNLIHFNFRQQGHVQY